MGYNLYKEINQRHFICYENVFDVNTLKEIEKISKRNIPINDTGGNPQSPYKRNTTDIHQKSIPPLFMNSLDSSILKANEIFNFDLERILRVIYAEYPEKVSGLSWHMDTGGHPYNTRKISFSINVNDSSEFEGGDLEFNNGNIEAPPQSIGSITIFPSFLLHRVAPVTKGVRKVIVGFIGGPPYK